MKHEIIEFKEKTIVYLTPPSPVVLVSTLSPNGNLNLAAFGQFTNCSDFPPMLCISITKESDTFKNIIESKEFVVGIPTPSIANQVSASGERLPREESEFVLTHLTPTKSKFINPSRIKECQINFECRFSWEKNCGDHHIIVGEVILAEIPEDIYNLDRRSRRVSLKSLYHASGSIFFKRGQMITASKNKYLEDYYKQRKS